MVESWDKYESRAAPIPAPAMRLQLMPALLALAALSVQPVPMTTTEFAPLLLDIDRDGVRVGHVDYGVRFDVDADGTDELVAWTVRVSFLAVVLIFASSCDPRLFGGAAAMRASSQ